MLPLNSKVIIALVLSAGLMFAGIYTYNLIYSRGADSVQRKWDAAKAEQDRESARVATEALSITKKLQEGADAQRKDYDEKIAVVNRSLAIALARLRERPSRPSAGDLSKAASTGTGCTGAQLYRPDGEFLTRFAHRAESLRVRLESCEADYARAAALLK